VPLLAMKYPELHA